jgi:hypothetical protein
MAAAFADPDIDDQAMRRVAGRLSCFAEELVDCRRGLRRLAHEPALRAVASRLDAVCFELQKQLKGFVSGVVGGLDPEVLRQRREASVENDVDVAFTLRIEMDEALAEVDAWIERARGASVCPAPVLAVQEEESASHVSQNADRLANVMTGLLVVVLLLLILVFGNGALFFFLLAAIVIFVIRHPLMALIAFIVLGS